MGGKQAKAIEKHVRGLEEEVSSVKSEVLSTKASLGASRNAVEVLKQQVSATQKTQQATEMQLHKAIREFENRLAWTNVEVSSTNSRLKASKEEVDKLKEHISSREKLHEDVGRKLQRMAELEKQIHCSVIEELSTKIDLELVNMDVKTLKERISSCDEFHQEMVNKLGRIIEIENQLSNNNVEMVATQSTFESLKKDENRLREKLLAHDIFEQDMQMKLRYVLELENELHSASSRRSVYKGSFEALKVEEDVLREQLSGYEKFQERMKMKVNKIMELEKEVCSSSSDEFTAKTSIEFLEKQERVLKDELLVLEKHQNDIESELCKYLHTTIA